MKIYKSKNGTYDIEGGYVDQLGIRHRIHKRGYDTKKEALHAVALFEIEQKDHRYNYSFATLCDEWLKNRQPDITRRTYQKYESEIRLYFRPYFKNEMVKDLNALKIQKWKEYLNGLDKLSVKTKNSLLTDSHAVWKYGMDFYGIDVDPFTRIRKFKVRGSTPEMSVWTEDQFKAFCEVLINEVDNLYLTIFVTLYWTGLRKGELRGLRWSDINLDKATLSVKRQVNPLGEVTTPKTNGSVRTIKLTKYNNGLLIDLKKAMTENHGFTDAWYVFGDKEPINMHKIERHHLATEDKAGLPHIRIHDYRHSHASYLIGHGYNIVYVSRRLGHESINTTLRVYTHLMQDVQSEEDDKLYCTPLV